MRPLDPLRYIKHKIFPNSVRKYFPQDAWTDPGYEKWFLANRACSEELERQRRCSFEHTPKFSIVVLLFKTPIEYLAMMAESVLAQTYGNFELILVNASPEDLELSAAVDAVVSHDDRVCELRLEKNYGIAENTNRGVAVATGDFVCFLDHDDFVEPDLLFEYASVLNESSAIDVLYCDEDMVEAIDGAGKKGFGGGFRYTHPLFKPSFAPEFLLCKDYVLHFMAIRSDVVRQLPRADSGFDGTQDYHMVLNATSIARNVRHVPKVLYHWRISEGSTATNPEAKPYTQRAYRRAAFNRINVAYPGGSIVASGITNIHNLWFDTPGKSEQVLVSLVVIANPEKDISAFEEMLRQSNTYARFEVIQAACGETCYGCANEATQRAKGAYVLFLSSEDILYTPDAVQQLVALCSAEGIGAVAAKCLYFDNSVKSYGIAVTPERIMPLYRGYPDEFPAYQCNTRALQNVSAVSWRGMMVKRELFEEVDGFDESYEGEIGSADFCQKLLARGLRIVQTPTVKVQTGEMPPQKRYDCIANSPEFTARDLAVFDAKWPGVRAAGDPYFNRNFDQSSEYCQIKKEFRKDGR